MALASYPAFQGQQRSLRRIRQVLSWAFARSPGLRNRTRAVGVRLRAGLAAALVRGEQRVPGTGVALVRQDDQPPARQFPQDPLPFPKPTRHA